MPVSCKLIDVPNTSTLGQPEQAAILEDLRTRLDAALAAGWTILAILPVGEFRVLVIATKP